MAYDVGEVADGSTWLIRTDFSDQMIWELVAQQAATDVDQPNQLPAQDVFELIDDRALEGLTPAGLLNWLRDRYGTYLLFDGLTVAHPEHPILAVDVKDEPGAGFRLIPSQVQGFAVNMSLSNMDFADFADGVDADGIFRGFHVDPHRPIDIVGDGSGAQIDSLTGDLERADPNRFGRAVDNEWIARTIPVRFGEQPPPGSRPHL